MVSKFIYITLILFLVSCSLTFDKEIINYGPDLKSFDQINIKSGETSKSYIIKKFGPPSFINPYNNKNVFYVSQKMIKEVGKVNKFQEVSFLEIFYNENDKVIKFNYKIGNLPNSITLSELDEKSIMEDRSTFELLKNIFSNLRRRSDN